MSYWLPTSALFCPSCWEPLGSEQADGSSHSVSLALKQINNFLGYGRCRIFVSSPKYHNKFLTPKVMILRGGASGAVSRGSDDWVSAFVEQALGSSFTFHTGGRDEKASLTHQETGLSRSPLSSTLISEPPASQLQQTPVVYKRPSP